MSNQSQNVPWFLWPFYALFRLIGWIILTVGRMVAAIIGLVLMIAGVIVSLTIVGVVVGVPLAIFGFLLVLKSLS